MIKGVENERTERMNRTIEYANGLGYKFVRTIDGQPIFSQDGDFYRLGSLKDEDGSPQFVRDVLPSESHIKGV